MSLFLFMTFVAPQHITPMNLDRGKNIRKPAVAALTATQWIAQYHHLHRVGKAKVRQTNFCGATTHALNHKMHLLPESLTMRKNPLCAILRQIDCDEDNTNRVCFGANPCHNATFTQKFIEGRAGSIRF